MQYMKKIPNLTITPAAAAVVVVGLVTVIAVNCGICRAQRQSKPAQRKVPFPRAALNLKEIGFKIVFESYRRTRGKANWELLLTISYGSNPINLTKTPNADEMYAKASPYCTKI